MDVSKIIGDGDDNQWNCFLIWLCKCYGANEKELSDVENDGTGNDAYCARQLRKSTEEG